MGHELTQRPALLLSLLAVSAGLPPTPAAEESDGKINTSVPFSSSGRSSAACEPSVRSVRQSLYSMPFGCQGVTTTGGGAFSESHAANIHAKDGS